MLRKTRLLACRLDHVMWLTLLKLAEAWQHRPIALPGPVKQIAVRLALE